MMMKNTSLFYLLLMVLTVSSVTAQDEGEYAEGRSEVYDFELGFSGGGGDIDFFDDVEQGINYALIIGVEEYQDEEIRDLKNPVKDSEKLYSTLTDIYSFAPDYTTMLRNATRKEIIDALESMTNLVTPQDNLLIFYAGHGYWDADKRNGYWFPSDANYEDKSTWFRNSTLRDYVKDIESKHTLLIVDACFSGGIFETRALVEDDADQDIQLLHNLKSRSAITSGALTEVSDNSVFMDLLVKNLEANLEKYLPAERLFYQFKESVINNSENAQIPQFGAISGTNSEGGDFIFVRKK